MADFVDMHDLGDMLVHAGFADPVMDQEVLTLRWRRPRGAAARVAALGGNAAPDRFAGLRTPRWHARLLAGCATWLRPMARSPEFEVAYGHAFKAAPRVPPSEETTVSLDDMRAMVRTKSAWLGPLEGRESLR
jgi:malonyl-CoA O-methyltransferase